MAAAKVFAQKGYDRATVREISEELNISSGLIYYYIGAKSDIVSLMLSEGERLWEDFFEKNPADLERNSATEVLCHTIEDYMVRNDRYRHFMRFWYRELRYAPRDVQQVVLGWNAKLVDTFEKILAEGYARGEFRTYVNVAVSHMIVIYGEAWALKPWLLRKHFTLEEYIKGLIQMVVKVLGVDEKTIKAGLI
jgi:AcrR family transcriptional regulator